MREHTDGVPILKNKGKAMDFNKISKIEEKVKNKEKIKSNLKRLESLRLNDYVNDSDLLEIDKVITELKDQLRVKKLQEPKNLDFCFDKFDLDYEKIEYTEFEYLHEYFITKNELTMIAAPPGSGKSLISVALANMFLLNNSVNIVVYFDADNGSATLKERGTHLLKKTWANRFRYFHESSADVSEMWQIIRQMQKTNLIGFIIFFDSIKNFMGGKDRDKNKDVSLLMEILQSLRAKGATIVFLHHTNKPQRDLEELVYAGSSAFQESTGNAYILQKNDYKNAFLFKNFKARTGRLKNVAFAYNSNHTLIELDFLEASETQEMESIRKQIIIFIEQQTNKPIYSQIMKHLRKLGFPQNKSNIVLQNGKGRLWHETKLSENNKSVYSIIYKNENELNN